jgi:hypothetical protein
MLPSLSGTRSIDDVASAYLPAREAAMVVARANEYASRQLGPVVGVKTIKRVSAIEGLSTGDADFANAIFAQNQTPYMRIVEYADAGSPYHRAMAEELLDKIFDTPYRGLPIGERKMISRAVTNHVKRFNYPDRWYRMKDLRRV